MANYRENLVAEMQKLKEELDRIERTLTEFDSRAENNVFETMEEAE